jgi:hypothetical protein
MNCLQCTFYNEVDLSKKNYCAVCNAELILTDDTFDFNDWLRSIGLGDLRDKVSEEILNSDKLEKDLDTSSKVSRKHAIRLAYHVGLRKGEKNKRVNDVDKIKSKEKILEDRLIIQEQDLRSEILILQEKLEESEKKVKEIMRIDTSMNSLQESKVELIQQPDQELSREERRKIIADSWLKK